MGALSDLLKNGAGMPANIAKTANLGTEPAGYSQDSQDSQGCEPEIRAHLMHLAESEGVEPAHVHRLHADDVAACAGESDNTLRAYLRALERDAGMDAGRVPLDWTTAAHCEGCGQRLRVDAQILCHHPSIHRGLHLRGITLPSPALPACAAASAAAMPSVPLSCQASTNARRSPSLGDCLGGFRGMA